MSVLPKEPEMRTKKEVNGQRKLTLDVKTQTDP